MRVAKERSLDEQLLPARPAMFKTNTEMAQHLSSVDSRGRAKVQKFDENIGRAEMTAKYVPTKVVGRNGPSKTERQSVICMYF